MTLIRLLPLGNADAGIVRELVFPLHKAFDADVTLVSADVPLQRFYDPDRGQYNSTALLRYLRGNSGNASSPVDRGEVSLAVTASDLFIPILTYVFGEAELGGGFAVASYYRLQNELYGLPPNRALLVRRLIKESLHELGHAVGLVHCASLSCVMHASTYVEDIDLKGEDFCPECAKLIRR